MDAQTIRQRMTELHSTLVSSNAELARVSGVVDQMARSAKEAAAAQAARARHQADAWLEKELRAADASSRAAQVKADTELQDATARCAPGALGAAWSDDIWPSPEALSGTAEAVRIGGYTGQWDSLGVLGPLLSPGVWVMDGDTDDFWGLQSALLLRLVGAYGPGRVRSHTWDPEFRSYTGAFSALSSKDASCVPSASGTVTGLRSRLDQMLNDLRRDVEGLRARGYGSAEDAVAAGDAEGIPVRLFFLGAPVEARDEETTRALVQLMTVCAGQSALVVATKQVADSLDTKFPRQVAFRFSWSGASVVTGDTVNSPAVGEPGPSGRALVAAVDALASRTIRRKLPVISLPELMDNDSFDKWIDEGDEGVTAVIGRTGTQELTVSLSSANPPTPNCLVGGAVGQGKTNLLLALIHSLADRYSPADLQMVLLDLKDGVEFNVLGPDRTGRNWLPHLRSLGLAFDIDYVVSVLSWATDELKRRNETFRKSEVSSLAQYRGLSLAPMPRLVIIIDEFHRMFESDDDRSSEAVGLLENLSRTGRSAGVHVILSSQTTSGIPALAVKSSAIFSQYHNRLSLKNSPEESEAILSAGNTAAAELDERGEIIVNNDLGRQDRNIHGRVAYATGRELRLHQEELFRRGAGAAPVIFDSQAPAVWDPEAVALAGGGDRILSPGRLVSLENPAFFVKVPPSTAPVAVIGRATELAHAVLASCLVSCSLSTGPLRITVLEGTTAQHPTARWLDALGPVLSARGHTVTRLRGADITAWITAPDPSCDVLVPIHVDDVPELSVEDDMTFRTPLAVLTGLMASLPRSGMTVLGWWDSMAGAFGNSFSEDGLFHRVILTGAGKSDYGQLCGPFRPVPADPWRAVVVTPGDTTSARTVVPYDLETIGVAP